MISFLSISSLFKALIHMYKLILMHMFQVLIVVLTIRSSSMLCGGCLLDDILQVRIWFSKNLPGFYFFKWCCIYLECYCVAVCIIVMLFIYFFWLKLKCWLINRGCNYKDPQANMLVEWTIFLIMLLGTLNIRIKKNFMSWEN